MALSLFVSFNLQIHAGGTVLVFMPIKLPSPDAEVQFLWSLGE